jgi:hypothetical protein
MLVTVFWIPADLFFQLFGYGATIPQESILGSGTYSESKEQPS